MVADRLRAAAASGLVLATLCLGSAEAADPRAGRQKAVTCQGCHGLDGLSKHPEAPNLAGQIENYLAKAIMEYRSGVRQNEMMAIAAKDLSDQDAADLAAFYASIQIEVIPP
jgi:cytochrome c553